jgi:hypothetical protein
LLLQCLLRPLHLCQRLPQALHLAYEDFFAFGEFADGFGLAFFEFDELFALFLVGSKESHRDGGLADCDFRGQVGVLGSELFESLGDFDLQLR